MSLCDFFPDDESCQTGEPTDTTDPVVDGGDGGEPCEGDDCPVECEGEDCPVDDECEGEDCEAIEELAEWAMLKDLSPVWKAIQVSKIMEFTSRSPTMGNIAYISIASAAIIRTCMQLFRYTNQTNYWKAFEFDSTKTNWYKLGSTIQLYTDLSVWGLLWVFQLLAMLGIMTNLNVMMWTLLGSLGALVKVVVWIFNILHIDGAVTAKKNMAPALAAELSGDLAWDAMYSVGLLWHVHDWMWAQWVNTPEEQQEAAIEELMMMVDEMEKEIAEAIKEEIEEEIEEEKAEEGEEGEEDEDAAEDEEADA